MPKTAESTSGPAIRERLQILLENHPQAEIARRTGFPAANVHRFLHGGKIPAEFCGAIVREFGLNPAWLLAGEGAPRLSDVNESTARMAGNVLELVEAMSAVARMRLGSLTGKHHLHVLRELNDALEDHERLRQRINEHSRPVFEQLIRDIDKQLTKRDLQRAAELIKAAEQVERLCGDEQLSLALDEHRAFHAFLTRDFGTSADFRRRVFIRQLGGGLDFDEQRLHDAQYFVMALLGTGRAQEALRVARATLDLATGPKGYYYACMQTTVGMLQLNLGDMRAAMADIHAGLPEAAGLLQNAYLGSLAKMQLLSGLMTVHEVLTTGPFGRSKSDQVLLFASWLEDAPALKEAVEKCTTTKQSADPDRAGPTSAVGLHAKAVQEALKGRKARTAAALKLVDAMPCRDARDRAAAEIARCQVLRLMGKRKQAEAALKQAQAVIDGIDPEIFIIIEYRAIHARNQVELGHEHGREFFREHYQRGYACFHDMAVT